MSRRVFSDGALLEEWDDDALVHGELVDGVWQTRPYTEDEKPQAPVPDPFDQDLDDLTAAVLAAL